MKNVIGAVMLMLMLAVPAVFAEDVTNETTTTNIETSDNVTIADELGIQPISQETAENATTEPTETATAEVSENETPTAIPVLISAPVENATAATGNETTEIKGGQDYSWFDQVIDNIKLTFTFNDEKRAQLIVSIEAKRDAHYQFLIAKGKTDQAERFKEGTVKLAITLNKTREKISERQAKLLQKFENKSAKIGQGKQVNQTKIEQRVENFVNRSETAREKADQRIQNNEKRTQNLQNRTQAVEDKNADNATEA